MFLLNLNILLLNLIGTVFKIKVKKLNGGVGYEVVIVKRRSYINVLFVRSIKSSNKSHILNVSLMLINQDTTKLIPALCLNLCVNTKTCLMIFQQRQMGETYMSNIPSNVTLLIGKIMLFLYLKDLDNLLVMRKAMSDLISGLTICSTTSATAVRETNQTTSNIPTNSINVTGSKVDSKQFSTEASKKINSLV